MTATDGPHPVARLGGEGRLDGAARRIVSLLPSATEIVCALGLEDRLVAVTHECDFPTDVVARLPRITANLLPAEVAGSRQIDAAVREAVADGHGLYSLDERMLAELAPDLILTQELCRVCAVSYPTVVEAARVAGGGSAPLLVSLEPHALDDVLRTIRLVAELAGEPERGEALVARMSARLDAIQPPARRRRTALVEWLAPLFEPGHWVPEQVERAGGVPVIGRAGEPSRELAWEALHEAQPEVVVLGLCGFDLPRTLDEWRTFDAPAPLQATPAWRTAEVWAIDGSAHVSRPGPRLVDGVEQLNAIVTGRPQPGAARLPTATAGARA